MAGDSARGLGRKKARTLNRKLIVETLKAAVLALDGGELKVCRELIRRIIKQEDY